MGLSKLFSKEFVKCDKDMTVSSVIGKLINKKLRCALVFDGKKFLGIVSRRKMLTLSSNPEETKIDKCLCKVPILNQDHSVGEAVKLLLGTSGSALPYEEKGKVVGIIEGVVFAQYFSEKIPSNMLLGDLELEKPSPLSGDDKVSTAIKIMLEEQVYQALLFEGRDLQGVVSVSDLLKYVQLPKNNVGPENVKLSSLPVSNFATLENLKVVDRTMTVKEAAALLREYGIRDLIVKEDDKVYGLFTVRSFLRFVMRENDRALLNIHYSGIGKTSLERTEAFKLRDFCSNEAKRFSERFGEVESFNFRFKEMKSGGKSHKYSVHLRVMMGSNELQTESSGWDLLKAVKDCYKSLTVLVKKGQGR